MGGLYGNAAATALEDCPEAARGLLSGMLQQGVRIPLKKKMQFELKLTSPD